MERITIRYTGTRTASAGYPVQGYTTYTLAAGQNPTHHQRVVDDKTWEYLQKNYPLDFIRVPDDYDPRLSLSEELRLVPGLTDKDRDLLVASGFQTTGEVIATATMDRGFAEAFRTALDVILGRVRLDLPGTVFAEGVAEATTEDLTDGMVDESDN